MGSKTTTITKETTLSSYTSQSEYKGIHEKTSIGKIKNSEPTLITS